MTKTEIIELVVETLGPKMDVSTGCKYLVGDRPCSHGVAILMGIDPFINNGQYKKDKGRDKK